MPLIPDALKLAHRVAARRHGGRVRYQRGDQVVLLDAVYGRQEQLAVEVAQGSTSLATSDRDFVFRADQLGLGGQRIEPGPGDRITVVDGGPDQDQVYEVLPASGAQCWRGCDPQHHLVRVFTRRIQR